MKKQLLVILMLFISYVVVGQEKPFWNEIKAFKVQDSIQPPKDGMILFIGSSSFRLWKTLQEDFKNPTILNRGFGGATLKDMIRYQDAIVLRYTPKKILIYCGENDIASSETMTPQLVLQDFQTLYQAIRKKLPVTPIVYVSIKPCPLRWAMKDRMIATNNLIKDFLSKDKQATFVNIWDAMLDNGVPKEDIFIEDHLHMNAKGYAIWVKALELLVNQ